MITKILTNEQAKALIGEIFFNKQKKVTKISDESVNNAIFFGTARLSQLATKDIAVLESQLFTSSASGSNLDTAGARFSSLERFTASGSSTYVLVIADSGTVYPAGTIFTSTSGIEFESIEEFTVDDNEYGYIKVRSTTDGKDSNVDPNTITGVKSEPTGHDSVINEFMAIGGRDNESDLDFRNRISSHPNLQARQTLAYLEEAFRTVNEDVLILTNLGVDTDGKLTLQLTLQNGSDLTQQELDDLLDSTRGFFALSDLNVQGDVINVKIVNTTWYNINGTTGVDFRLELFNNFDPDEVRKNIQIAMSKYLDPRNWINGGRVEWDNLLQIVKDTEGVKYVQDSFFNPSEDQVIPVTQFPRILRFVMRDLDGNIISDNNGFLSPVFYPNN
jgi:hypothetical protein